MKSITKYSLKELKKDIDNGFNETILITGGNSGIGLEFIKQCLKENYQVIFTVRDSKKGESTLTELKRIYPFAKISYLLLDLSNIDSINNFVNHIISNHIDIHHFYNNAGIFRIPFSVDENNFEINFMTNYFGPYILNDKLLKYFLTFNHEVHINFTYSLTTYYYKLDYSKFNPQKEYKKLDVYAQSKHAVVHMYYYFLIQYQDTNLSFSLSHPGATYTPLIVKGFTKNRIFQFLAKCFMKIVFHSPNKASYTYRLSLRKKIGYYYIAPRGPFELSGYPKLIRIRIKQIKDYKTTIEKTKELLKDYL